MTTIVAMKGRMVSDSKVSLGKGYSYPATKIIKTKGMLVGAAGLAGDCSRFLEWAQDEFKAKSKPKFEAVLDDDKLDGLIVKADGVYYFCPEYPFPELINADFYGVGSGSKAARAAMIMGATLEEAVTIACQVDDYSGLPLQILELE
jgi:hypothetical protein